MTVFDTINDIRNWVDSATANWDNRTDDDVEQLTKIIRDSIDYGRDCSEYLNSLPDNLAELLA